MSNRVEKLMERLTLEQKIGQMIIIRGHDYEPKTRKMNETGIVGGIGVVLFTAKGSRELEDIVSLVNTYNSASSTPLLYYTDAESGLAGPFDFGTPFPTLMALGATGSKDLAYKMGNCIAKEAKAIGFNCVCNPVVDVNTNPDNPIVNTRAISDQVDLVSELAVEMMSGMQDADVIPLAKHFPGHGDTSVDSHVSMPVVERNFEDLMRIDLMPYRRLISQGLMGIMTVHILFPALLAPGEERVPATLSKTIMTDLLRGQLGFEGILVSDSLTMRAIKTPYGIERAAVLAVKAGHDAILQDYESDPEITFQALVRAVETGELTMVQINESVRRILEVKEKFGLLEAKPIELEEARAIVNSNEHAAVAIEIAEKSVTVLESANLPFTGEKTLLITTKNMEEGNNPEDWGSKVYGKSAYLQAECSKYVGHLDFLVTNEDPTDEDIVKVQAALEGGRYANVIYAPFVRVISYKEGSGTIPKSQAELMELLKRQHPNAALVVFGSPYILQKISSFANCICAYGDCIYSINAALKVLFGKIQATGKLPVHVNEKYDYGYGL